LPATLALPFFPMTAKLLSLYSSLSVYSIPSVPFACLLRSYDVITALQVNTLFPLSAVACIGLIYLLVHELRVFHVLRRCCKSCCASCCARMLRRVPANAIEDNDDENDDYPTVNPSVTSLLASFKKQGARTCFLTLAYAVALVLCKHKRSCNRSSPNQLQECSYL
jgi:hypothetical protein